MSDPVTAPELVEIVAEALLSVELDRAFDRNEDMVAFKEDLEACRMDARAVLAALTEAGSVEWGVQTKTFIDGDYDNMITAIQYRRITREVAQDHVDAMNSRYPIARVVSRLTLPWTAVE